MIAITNTKILRQCESRFSLILEQILAFALSTNLVREIKNKFASLHISIHFIAILLTVSPNITFK